MNKVFLCGFLPYEPLYGDDIEKPFVKFTLCCGEKSFVPVCCFDRQATFAVQYLKKGSKIEVEGHISSYKNKEGKNTISIVSDKINFIKTKQDNLYNTAKEYVSNEQQEI